MVLMLMQMLVLSSRSDNVGGGGSGEDDDDFQSGDRDHLSCVVYGELLHLFIRGCVFRWGHPPPVQISTGIGY